MIKEKTIEVLRSANRIVFYTGAGISAESGIPTFRGVDGIWNKLKPEELANFNAFLKNPKMVSEWYNHRRDIVHKAQPNNAHLTITKFQDKYDVKVITQNVDNLHRRAGNKIVYELHGNIERNYCIRCKTNFNENIPSINDIPTCTNCGGLIRPDVVWFGEMLPEDQFEAAQAAAENCDVFFIIGTTGIVYPAASLIYEAKKMERI